MHLLRQGTGSCRAQAGWRTSQPLLPHFACPPALGCSTACLLCGLPNPTHLSFTRRGTYLMYLLPPAFLSMLLMIGCIKPAESSWRMGQLMGPDPIIWANQNGTPKFSELLLVITVNCWWTSCRCGCGCTDHIGPEPAHYFYGLASRRTS